ncbi:ABA4-like family protein [Parafilimonas sp.]|uniref:ABA4-like family protein n=1 Tax=Parafilimonas sp. TaxID=1969739 RepID=UPI003F7FE982
MHTEQIFTAANMLAMAGWIILIFLPFWQASDKFIISIIITLMALVYTWLMFTTFKPADIESFSSLSGVKKLFENDKLVVAGWVHYLAFDLLAGMFIKNNGIRYNINHWLLAPCMLLTFLFGPAGLLLFLIIRLIKTKHYFPGNF